MSAAKVTILCTASLVISVGYNMSAKLKALSMSVCMSISVAFGDVTKTNHSADTLVYRAMIVLTLMLRLTNYHSSTNPATQMERNSCDSNLNATGSSD